MIRGTMRSSSESSLPGCATPTLARDQYLPAPLPAVLGHEGAGVVEKVGSRVKKVVPGDHVVSSYLSCGTCTSCVSGLPAYCHSWFPLQFSGSRTDGSITMKRGKENIHGSFFGQSSFASHALMTERNVVKVGKDMPLEKLAPLGCGVQTGAGGVMKSLKVAPGSAIAVFGMGSVGLSAVMAAYAVGATTIIAVDVNPTRLRMAKKLGATHLVHSKKVNPIEEIQKITGNGASIPLNARVFLTS